MSTSFDIGGHTIVIDDATLKHIPTLYTLVHGDYKRNIVDGSHVVDRDGTYFIFIMLYVTEGVLPSKFTPELLDEFRFYGIKHTMYTEEFQQIRSSETVMRTTVVEGEECKLELHDLFKMKPFEIDRGTFIKNAGIDEDDLILGHRGVPIRNDIAFDHDKFIDQLTSVQVATTIPSPLPNRSSTTHISTTHITTIHEILARRRLALCGGFASSVISGTDIYDFDFFAYDITPDEYIQYIIDIDTRFNNTCTRIRSANSITFTTKTMRFSFILRIYKNINEIMLGFDLDASCFALVYRDNKYSLLTSNRGLHALKYRVNCIDLTRRSPTYEWRACKYAQRGFAIYVPKFRRECIDRKKYKDLQLGKIYSGTQMQGLSKLLAFERPYITRNCSVRTKHRDHVLSDYDEGSNVSAMWHARSTEISVQCRPAVGVSYNATYNINNHRYDNGIVNISNELGTVKVKMISSDNIHNLLELNPMVTHIVDFPAKLTIMTENPGKQFTSSFNAIVDDDPDAWYQGMIHTW